MRKALTWACTRAGIRRRTPHALRHTAASLMIDKGCTIEDVREALGHRDLETTLKTYVHFFDPDGAKRRRLEAKVAVFG